MNKTVSQESAVVLGGLAVSAVGGLLAKYGPQIAKAIAGKVVETAGTKAMSAAKAQLASAASVGSDLVRFTQSARVEPILLMDKNALNVPFIQDVVHTGYNMFTGYWLLAVSLDTKINGVTVRSRLDRFATDRSLGDATMAMLTESLESYKPAFESFGLPFIEEIATELDEQQASLEANDMERANAALDIIEAASGSPEENKLKQMEAGWRREDNQANQKKLDEAARNAAARNGAGVANAAKYVEKVNNLAVGNVIDVTISEDGKEAVVPVTIRLRVAGMPSSVMVQTLAVGGRDVTFRSRWRAWRAGEIGFWADFVLAMDRVDAHRAAMMKDETGYYKAVYQRASNNSAAQQILKDGPSLSTASSILVMTAATASELERNIGSELKNFKTRQGIFGHTYSMLMIIVDPDWESVTIYTRGIEMPTQLTAKDLKTAGKSDSKELMEILKAYQLGRAPGRF